MWENAYGLNNGVLEAKIKLFDTNDSNGPMNIKISILNCTTIKKTIWSSTNVINIKNRNTAQLLTFLQHSLDLSVLLMFS